MSTPTELNQRDDLHIAQRAAAWLSALKQDDGAENRAAFVHWLRESPRHVEEVLFATAVEQAFANFDRERKWDIDALLAQVPANVVTLAQADVEQTYPLATTAKTAQRKAPRNERKISYRWATGLAAAIALFVVWGLQSPWLNGWKSYATTVGEQRIIELEDGSLVHLNTDSRVQVRYTDGRRDLRLAQGEALFKVAHDPAHPFRVHADDTVIQALGTSFNVYRRERDTTVSVIEGLVRIDTPVSASQPEPPMPKKLLGKGEEASITDGRIVKRKAPDLAQLATWRQRRLAFKADTLEDIAAEFNRYNRSPKIRIASDDIRHLRFTGIFDADDPMSLVQLLNKDRALAVEKKADELVIRSKENRLYE